MTLQRSYDNVARGYAEDLFGELARKPFDRALLDRIVEQVGNAGVICDMGCGPGQVARYLVDHGAHAVGVDLSSGMLENARRLNPDIEYTQGDMRSLSAVADSSFAGIVAAYAIVNFARAELPLVFQEFHRTLRSNGIVLLSFHVGDEVRHISELYGMAVELDFFFYRPVVVTNVLAAAGFAIDEVLEREPDPDVEVQTRRCYIFARKER